MESDARGALVIGSTAPRSTSGQGVRLTGEGVVQLAHRGRLLWLGFGLFLLRPSVRVIPLRFGALLAFLRSFDLQFASVAALFRFVAPGLTFQRIPLRSFRDGL